MRLFIGLMSGTSMDGIDAALVDVDQHRLIKGITHAYSPPLQTLLSKTLRDNIQSAGQFKQLDTLVGREFAQAVEALLQVTQTSREQIIAIGSHGQTIFHDATASIPYTVQMGCGHTLAELTGIDVIADFRTRDMVVGGRGAPFAPLYHQVVFEKVKKPLAVVNIGGISNITYLENDLDVWGYDTGPGNCLLDSWASLHLGLPYDSNGQWAASGAVIETLLHRMLSDPYFTLPPPKSLGKEYFSRAWLLSYLAGGERPEDIQATLTAFTARTIANALDERAFKGSQVVLCGGGVHNQVLMERLSSMLPSHTIVSSQCYGVSPDYLEAMMFAWLADKALAKTPLDFRKITGAKQPVIAGAIYPVQPAHQSDFPPVF